MKTAPCTQCGKHTQDRVEIKKPWVSYGPVLPYREPLALPCCNGCKCKFLDDRAKYFAVMDTTMNTHRDFVRLKGQDGTIYGKPCKGWQRSDEVGVKYHVNERYKDYF